MIGYNKKISDKKKKQNDYNKKEKLNDWKQTEKIND